MNKEFIPYEQALALKELGFDEPCFGYFNLTKYLGVGSFIFKECNKDTIDGYGNKILLNPTYSQAFRWFRDKYDFVGTVLGDGFNGKLKGYYYSITEEGWINYYESIDDMKWYDTYEEAELACLNKLIEIVKTKKD